MTGTFRKPRLGPLVTVDGPDVGGEGTPDGWRGLVDEGVHRVASDPSGVDLRILP